VALGLLFISSCSAGTLTDASPGASQPASPSTSPSKTVGTPRPTASAAIDCRPPDPDSDRGQYLPGDTVHLQIVGFPPQISVTLYFHSDTDGAERGPIGATTVGNDGNAEIDVVIPSEAPFGYAQVRVIATETCRSEAHFLLATAEQSMSIDDGTVTPGQRVTLTAIGFAPDGSASLHLDCDPRETPCPQLGTARTSEVDGSVVMVVWIPEDIAAGDHFLMLYGVWVDQVGDLGLVAAFTVEGGQRMPPTDSASGG
jgi:hypothetical protein